MKCSLPESLKLVVRARWRADVHAFGLLGAVGAMLLAGAGCSPNHTTSAAVASSVTHAAEENGGASSTSDDTRLTQAIANLSSGKTIAAINAAQQAEPKSQPPGSGPKGEGDPQLQMQDKNSGSGTGTGTRGTVAEESGSNAVAPLGDEKITQGFDNSFKSMPQLNPAQLTDPGKVCGDVSVPAAAAPETEWLAALGKFGDCLRKAMEPVDQARGAFVYQVTFTRGLTEKALSQMSPEELGDFLKKDFTTPGALAGLDDATAPMRRKLRNRFSDSDLDEIVRLAHRLDEAVAQATRLFFAAVDNHRALVEHFAEVSNRYELLLAVRDWAARGALPIDLGHHVSEILARAGMQVPKHLDSFPNEMLATWSVVAISPDAGREADALKEPLENPFNIVERQLAQLGGNLQLVQAQRDAYARLRDADNPPLPEHKPPVHGAVRIAVVDTGVDYLSFPDLGEFLANGKGGAMSSYDFQDNDNNPYLPAQGEDAHGTGTAASVLTVLSHYAPEVLQERRLDLAVWKLNTIRNALSTPYNGIVSWESREAMPEALIREATDPTITLKPKIVSISAIFELQPFLTHSNHTNAVLKAPWLWVMAAGNEGVPADQDKTPVCLSDVPKEKRVDARILCVGALRRGMLHDKIAGYSNYGSKVDLYAYESYSDLCPNGTSCSTPAISGAAAAVAAKYPELTPEQIKSVLLEASERRTLEVDTTTAPQPQVQLIEGGATATHQLNWYEFHSPLLSAPDTAMANSARELLDASQPGPDSVSRTVNVLDPATMMPRIFEIARKKARRL